MTSRPLAVLVALCLLIAPVVSMAMELHDLSHAAQEAAQAHHVSHHDHTDDHDEDDMPSGLHAVLHGVTFCGQGLGILPSGTSPALADAPGPSALQEDIVQASVPPGLLFRPPRDTAKT